MLRRPNFFFTALVTIPSVTLFGLLAIVFGFWNRGKIGWIATFTKLNWSRWMLWSHGIKTQIKGMSAKEIKNLKGVVFVANHQSLLDIPVLFKYLPSNSGFIGKKELIYIPIFGWAAYVCGTIFIDRSKGAQNKSLDAVVDYLKSGRSVIIFPEGTRSKTGDLGAFKKGGFIFAIQAGVPVVPITIFNSRELLPKHRLAPAPGEVRIFVDQPIETKGMSLEDRNQLSGEIHNLISKRLRDA